MGPAFRARLTGSAVVLFCIAADAADAQYFGRNKVQYKDFDFQVLGTRHFDVYFYEEEREAEPTRSALPP